MKTIINEGLDYHDLEGQMDPIVSVDEYASTMGKDSDIVTLAFTIHSEQAGKDLVSWFERGYDWVLDASVSEGEVSRGKYLVFVELNRRAAVPGRIIELIDDLYTLTDLPLKDWNIRIDKEDHPADIEILKQFIITSKTMFRSSWSLSLIVKKIATKSKANKKLKPEPSRQHSDLFPRCPLGLR